MTSQRKAALVESVKDRYGLNLALVTVELPKSTWYYHQKHKTDCEEEYAHLLPILKEIARQHPGYGAPRIMPELRGEYDRDVNHKVIERLLGIWDLSLLRSTRHPKSSGIGRRSLGPETWPIWWLNRRRLGCFRSCRRFRRAPLGWRTAKGIADPHHRPCQ